MSDIDKYFAKFDHLTDPGIFRELLRTSKRLLGEQPAWKDHKYPLPAETPEYAYIGKIAVEWANLEAKIDELIAELCRPALPNLIGSLTAQMIGPGPRLQALLAICGEKGTSQVAIDGLLEFKKHATGVADQRNRFVHDSWHAIASLEGETILMTSVTAKGVFKRETKPVTAQEFQRLIYKIQKLNDIFLMYVRENIIKHTYFKDVFDKEP